MNFLREEKLVTINSKDISKNGFKNLTFETSRYSGGFDATRGFGSIIDSRNLSQVDQFNIDFIITREEIPRFAKMLAEFKAVGVLPIKNDFILNKIKSTLAYEKALLNLSSNQNKTLREITHINVFLEAFSIKSLERTSNGYEVSLILSLYNRGFSDNEMENFKNSFETWSVNSGFEEVVENAINQIDLNDGTLTLEFTSLEKINASIKSGALLQLKNESYYSEAEYLSGKNERDSLLNDYEDLNKKEVIEISSVNIGQLEMVVRNNISNIPLYGEPIGIKSFMGQSQSNLIVKLVFDESDNELINRLKNLSDQNTLNTVLTIKNNLLNIFDFHTASVSKIYFNNIEEANGIMVTIIFDINSYNYDSEDLNTTASFHVLTELDKNNNFELGSFYLELLAEEHKELSDSFIKRESQYKATDWFRLNEKREMIWNAPIQSILLAQKSGNNATNKTDSEVGTLTSWTFGDLFTAYQPQTDFFYKCANLSLKNKEKVKYNLFDFSTRIDRLTTREISNSYYYYDWIEAVSYAKVALDPEITRDIVSHFNKEKYKKSDALLKSFKSSFIEDTTAQMFNINFYKGEKIVLWFNSFYYELMLGNIFDTILDQINFETNHDFSTTTGIDFKRIYKEIENLLRQVCQVFSSYLNSDTSYEEAVKYIIINMKSTLGEYDPTLTNNKYVESIAKNELTNMKKVFDLEIDSRLDKYIQQAYAIFLTKLCDNFKYKNDINRIIDLEVRIKTMMISSAFQTFFHIKNEKMNVNLGLLLKESLNTVGYKIGTSLHASFKTDTDIKGTEELRAEEVFINKVYPKYANLSFMKERVKLTPWLKSLNEKTVESTVKKDYNFFYGMRVNYTTDFFINSFDYSNLEIAKNSINDYTDVKIKNFINGKEYVDKYDGLNKIAVGNKITPHLPTSYERIFFETDQDNNFVMNDRMKGRIIGNHDPFREVSALKENICDVINEVLPDYDVFVGSHLNEIGSGMMNETGLSNFIELSNVVEIKISKNPKTKIKSAKIVLNNFNKQLINKYGNESITLSVKKEGTGLELYSIKNGDDVMINLGHSNKKDMVFNGFIKTLQNFGNTMVLECSGYASGLYNKEIKKEDYKDQNFFQKNILSPINQSLLILSDRMNSKESVQYVNIFEIFAEQIKHMTNGHLFRRKSFEEISGGLRKEDDFNLDINISCTNLFRSLVGNLPSNIKSKFSGKSTFGGRAVMMKEVNRNINNVFGRTDEINLDEAINDTNSFIYSDIYNVDIDYDTYGFSGLEFDVEVFKYDALTKKYEESGKEHSEVNKPTQSETKEETKKVEQQHKENLGIKENELNFLWPTTSRKITSIYDAKRIHPIYKKEMPHLGIDIGSVVRGNKEAVFSAKDGTISQVVYSNSNKGAGNTIKIKHEGGYETRYLHLDSIRVEKGQTVKGGQIIGVSGSTGGSTGVHLHFEIIKNKKQIDPMEVLKK